MLTSAAQRQAREEARTRVAALLEEYYRPVFAYLVWLVNDRNRAEELAQEALSAALRASHQLPALPDRRAWLYHLATKTAFRAIDRRRRSRFLGWQERRVTPEEQSENAGRQNAAERALGLLPVEHRAPLLLYSHFELSLSEMASALGVSEDAAKTRLYRARRLFRNAYERELQDGRPR